MPTPNFAAAIALTLVNEGGDRFVDNPVDRGGPTRYGITLATLSAARRKECTANDVRVLTQAEAESIYKANYWEPLRCQMMTSQALACLLLDCGVLCGTQASSRMLQQAAGATVDGSIGPKTIAAVQQADSMELQQAFSQLWQRYLVRLVQKDNSQKVFLVGWLKRAAIAQAMPFLIG